MSEDKNNSKERVLMVHNFYQIGGGEHTVFENEKRLLKDNGHYLCEYTRDNAEISKSKITKLFLPFTTVFSFKTYREVKRLIRKEKIDIVHCHNTFPLISPSVYYAAWKCKVPVVQTIHNFRFICPNGVFFRDNKTCEDCLNKGLSCSLKHSCYRNSKIQTLVLVNMLRFHRIIGTYKKLDYIFLTNYNKGKFKRLLGKKFDSVFVKPNFEYITPPAISDKRENFYVFIGRLDKNKGIDFLVESWSFESDLYIFGNGMLENMVKLASEKNERIHYLGFQPQNEIWKYLSRAKAMLFPTDLYEGFPMTLIESFSMGTPVICSDIGNGADIVKSADAGVAYERRNKEALSKAINDIDEHFAQYSLNARNAYETQFTPEANYKQLKSIYEAISK